MTKVLFIVGSLRQGSFNQQLAAQAEKVLEGKAEVSYLDWKDIPVFSQELETPVLQLFKLLVMLFWPQMRFGSSRQYTTPAFLAQ